MESVRAPRRDAAENREHLLDVAEVYFADGVDAPLHGLARAAGVGVGTLYRHFATHDELVRALYERILIRCQGVEQSVAAATGPWEAIEAYLDGVLDVMRSSPATASVLERMRQIAPEHRPADRFKEPIRRMAARAHEDGSLRPDVSASDLGFVPYLLVSLLRFPEPHRSAVLPRMRAIVLDGLRTSSAQTPLVGEPLGPEAIHLAAHSQHPRQVPDFG